MIRKNKMLINLRGQVFNEEGKLIYAGYRLTQSDIYQLKKIYKQQNGRDYEENDKSNGNI